MRISMIALLAGVLLSGTVMAKGKPKDLECADGQILIFDSGELVCSDLPEVDATDSIQVTLGSDQTVSSPRWLGTNTQSNVFDDAAFVAPRSGLITDLAISTGQNIAAGVPQTPQAGESVVAFVLVVPYDNDATYPNTHGVPEVDLLAQIDVVVLEAAIAGGLDCTQPENAAIGGHAPAGSRFALFSRIAPGTQAGFCHGGELPVQAGDLVAVYVAPVGFTSFQPKATLVIETD